MPTSPTIQSPVSLSFLEVIRSPEPKVVFEKKLVGLLKKNLRRLGILWSAEAFQGGLHNHELPSAILRKFESLLSLASAVDWKVSKAIASELDNTIEDIETFNPPFRESLRRAAADMRAGKYVTHDELEREFGIAK
jgi:hypothetical protein